MSEQRGSGIVTPEAVVLEFETAGVGSRAIAKFLDILIQMVAFLVLALLVSFAVGAGGGGGAETIGIVLILLFAFLILFGYPAISEALWNGKTVGKAALGLRVVTREGAPIRFRHAAIRAVTALVEIYGFTFISIITTATSRHNQRTGDLMGGTIVIRERSAGDRAVAVSFPPPPGLESYVHSLDVSTLTSEQYGVVRSFLMRVFQFTPEARMALAVRLANPVAVSLRHDPPPMIGPELFLACVAAAYQARHGGPAAAWASAGGYPGMPPGYGAPAPMYGGPPGYGSGPAYGAPPGYGAPPAYGAPGPGYGGPPGYGTGPAYGAPPVYGAGPAYGAPSTQGPPGPGYGGAPGSRAGSDPGGHASPSGAPGGGGADVYGSAAGGYGAADDTAAPGPPDGDVGWSSPSFGGGSGEYPGQPAAYDGFRRNDARAARGFGVAPDTAAPPGSFAPDTAAPPGSFAPAADRSPIVSPPASGSFPPAVDRSPVARAPATDRVPGRPSASAPPDDAGPPAPSEPT